MCIDAGHVSENTLYNTTNYNHATRYVTQLSQCSSASSLALVHNVIYPTYGFPPWDLDVLDTGSIVGNFVALLDLILDQAIG